MVPARGNAPASHLALHIAHLLGFVSMHAVSELALLFAGFQKQRSNGAVTEKKRKNDGACFLRRKDQRSISKAYRKQMESISKAYRKHIESISKACRKHMESMVAPCSLSSARGQEKRREIRNSKGKTRMRASVAGHRPAQRAQFQEIPPGCPDSRGARFQSRGSPHNQSAARLHTCRSVVRKHACRSFARLAPASAAARYCLRYCPVLPAARYCLRRTGNVRLPGKRILNSGVA